MNEARSLISAFLEIDSSDRKTVAFFSPSLVGMFGSVGIFDSFLSELDKVLATGNMPASIKKRAANLIGTFIPQVAEYNGIKNPSQRIVTADELRNISPNSLESRRIGVEMILSALLTILEEVSKIDAVAA